MIRAVFWDNDGVLVDTEGLYFQATREALSQAGIDFTRDQFIQISLNRGRSAFEIAAQRGVDPGTIAALRSIRNRRYSELLQNGVPVLEGVAETISRLQGKLLMGVVTSSRREHFEIIHAATGLLPYFDFVLTRENYLKTKPDPEPYLTAIKRSGVNRNSCIIVEDSERGLAAAKAAGIRCVVVPHALTKDSNFSGAWKILDSVERVAAIVSALCT
jgi:HAD superfamily hydrolase (TIGR01509 family)